MNYREFKEELKNCVTRVFSDIGHIKVSDGRFYIQNNCMDGLYLESSLWNVPWGFPVNSLYCLYEHGVSFAQCFDTLRGDIIKAINEEINNVPVREAYKGRDKYSYEKDNILFSLVNKVDNEELLQNSPHRDFVGGLAITYTLARRLDRNGECIFSVVTDEVMNMLNLNEEELYRIAGENVKRLIPFEAFVCNGPFGEFQSFPLSSEDDLPFVDKICDMLMVSSCFNQCSTIALLCPDILDKIAVEYGGSFYIIPSSTEDFICMGSEKYAEDLGNHILEVNSSLEIGMRLSNQVFYYDTQIKKVAVVGDNPMSVVDLV